MSTAASANKGHTVDISVHNVPFEKVIQLVADQTGYKITVNEHPSIMISCNYKNIDLTTLFGRLLHNYNLSIINNDVNKTIELKILGLKKGGSNSIDGNTSHHKTAINTVSPRTLPLSSGTDDFNTEDPFTGKTRAQIRRLHDRQSKEIANEISDPGTIDPLTGLSNEEVWLLHEEQAIEIANQQAIQLKE